MAGPDARNTAAGRGRGSDRGCCACGRRRTNCRRRTPRRRPTRGPRAGRSLHVIGRRASWRVHTTIGTRQISQSAIQQTSSSKYRVVMTAASQRSQPRSFSDGQRHRRELLDFRTGSGDLRDHLRPRGFVPAPGPVRRVVEIGRGHRGVRPAPGSCPTTLGTATSVWAATVVVVVGEVGTVVVVVAVTGPVLRSKTTVECAAAVVIDLPAVSTTRATRPTGVVGLEIICEAGQRTTRCSRVNCVVASLQVSPMRCAGSRTVWTPSETVDGDHLSALRAGIERPVTAR